MFCPYCGNKILEHSSFCTNCGKNIIDFKEKNQTVQPALDFQKNAIRESEINLLKEPLQYFSLKKNTFYEYDRVCDLLIKYSKGAKSVLLVFGCIIFTIGLLLNLFSFEDANTSDFTSITIAVTLPGFLMLSGGILMKINNKRKYNKYREKYFYLSQELYHYCIGYKNSPLGLEYSNPEILLNILYLLNSGHADTIKEALNILITSQKLTKINNYFGNLYKVTYDLNSRTNVSIQFVPSNLLK